MAADQISPSDLEEEPKRQRPRKIAEKLGIVDQHVSVLRENPNTEWIRKLDFDSKVKPALNKYKELGFSEVDLNILAKRWPEGLILNNDAEKKMDIFELSDHLASKYGVKGAEQVREIVTSTPESMMASRKTFDERVDRLAKHLQLDENQVSKVVGSVPRLVFCHQKRVDLLDNIFRQGLHYSTDQLIEILRQKPYLFTAPLNELEQSHLSLMNKGFSSAQIRQIFNELPIVLGLKAGNFRQTFNFLTRYIPEQTVRDIYMKHPLLFTVDFAHFFIKKIQHFEHLKFTQKETLNFFTAYPEIFIKSLNAMKTKTSYLVRRGRLVPKEDKAFPAILAFKYSEFVRARGELMTKYPKVKRLPWAQVLTMSDEEFLAHHQAPAEELVAIQREVEQTSEIDVTDKSLFRFLGRIQFEEDSNQEKIRVAEK